MKEAQGELNLVVVIVTLIAFLSFFFFSILWPNIRSNFAKNTKCDEAICATVSNSDGTSVNCVYTDPKGNKTNIICPWKG